MLGKSKSRYRVYPEGAGKLFLETWLEVGTLALTCKVLYEKGIKSRKGEAPHYGSVRQLVNKWMCDNMPEARAILLANGYDRLSDDLEWAAFLIPRAYASMRESVFFRWLLKNNFLRYARQLKLVPENYGKDRTI